MRAVTRQHSKEKLTSCAIRNRALFIDITKLRCDRHEGVKVSGMPVTVRAARHRVEGAALPLCRSAALG